MSNVVGTLVSDWDAVEAGPAGCFMWAAENAALIHKCPCGCGTISSMRIRQPGKPVEHPSWEWDGNREKPTCSPSVLKTIGCKWHGYLKAGVCESC